MLRATVHDAKTTKAANLSRPCKNADAIKSLDLVGIFIVGKSKLMIFDNLAPDSNKSKQFLLKEIVNN